jgi:hypothetical protein
MDAIRRLFGYRFLVFGVASAAVVGLYFARDPLHGQDLIEQLTRLVGVLPAAIVVYWLRRGFADAVRGKSLAEMIEGGNVAAGIAYLGLCILTGLLFLAVAPRALAGDLPPGAVQHLPTLAQEIDTHWPDMPMRSVLAAQVEQESGWRVNATLKTSREEGVGLGQFTRAYDSRGRLRFDALADIAKADAALATWAWADRYNPRMQLRAVTVKNRQCYRHFSQLVPASADALAMCDAAYNCGQGCVYSRRRLCAQVAGCNAAVWFGGAERYSSQSKTRWHGYGQSAHDITNTHVRNVMHVRRGKYAAYFQEA